MVPVLKELIDKLDSEPFTHICIWQTKHFHFSPHPSQRPGLPALARVRTPLLTLQKCSGKQCLMFATVHGYLVHLPSQLLESVDTTFQALAKWKKTFHNLALGGASAVAHFSEKHFLEIQEIKEERFIYSDIRSCIARLNAPSRIQN